VSEKREQETFRRSGRRFVQCHSNRLQDAIAYPQEDARVKVMNDITRRDVADRTESVKNVPIELIFNLHDVGCQEWADQNAGQIITTDHIESVGIEYSAPWQEKRINCIATKLMAVDTLMG
jgi:hypothetical protein